jgi:biotin transport system substrate-specific component
MSSVRTLTLADAALPGAGVLRDVLLVVGASLLTAAAARIALPLPWSPVPLTGQTFAVLLTGAALGARRAVLAQALYLVEGAMGLPHGWDRRFGTMLAAMLLGSAVLFVSGLAGLSRFMPADRLLAAGLLPFLPGEAIKVVAAALVLPAAWRFAHGHPPREDRG